jgi:LPXTG-motif cell wall-anchored protein
VDVDISGGYGHFEVDGLTNDQEYSVEVRGVDGDLGAGAASEALPGTPYKSIGALGTPSVQVVGSSLTITWTAPTTTGTYPLAGYRVAGYVSTVDGGGGETELCRTGVTVLSCTVAVTPGNSYVVLVNAIDAKAHYSWESDPAASTGPIPKPAVPSTVPTKDGDLTGPAGSGITTIVPGKTVVLKGTGFLPNSTVTAIIYSAPQQLATFVTDGTGSFEYTVTIPEGLEAGQHSLVVTGVGTNGAVRNLRVDVTVAASGTTVVTAAKLAATGADVTGPMIGGLAALAAGAGLIVTSRRRRTAA